MLQVTADEKPGATLGPDEPVPCDPIQLAIFSHRFMGIAEQMGRTLQRTSVSFRSLLLHHLCILLSASVAQQQTAVRRSFGVNKSLFKNDVFNKKTRLQAFSLPTCCQKSCCKIYS
jgi:hypothetical protein